MSSQKRAGAISATELMARLQKDPEYQRKKAAFDAELRERVSVLRAAERPILADLHAAGIHIDSVWDLVNTSEPYPAALPVLMEHLEHGGYPERVMESLGRALAVKPAVTFWARLKSCYLTSRDPGEEDGTAVALAACATKAQLNDLIGFLTWMMRRRRSLRQRCSCLIRLRLSECRGGRLRGLPMVSTARLSASSPGWEIATFVRFVICSRLRWASCPSHCPARPWLRRS
jgi:hypothetical protein